MIDLIILIVLIFIRQGSDLSLVTQWLSHRMLHISLGDAVLG